MLDNGDRQSSIELKATIRKFLSRYLRLADVEDDQDIVAGGLVNSLFAMQLVLFVEKEFGATVQDQDLDLKNFRSIQAIAEFVDRKTRGAPSSRQQDEIP